MIAPCEHDLFSTCIFLNILVLFSIIFMCLCLVAVYRMCRSYKKLKFENYVLLSGILESITFIIAIQIQNEYVLQIIEFLQIIVVLFITRRFLKIYLTLEKKKSNTKFYNYFFIFFVIINILFILVMIVLIFMEIMGDEKIVDHGDSDLMLAHNSFCFLSSSILFILGLRIKKMITKSLSDVNRISGLKDDSHLSSSYIKEINRADSNDKINSITTVNEIKENSLDNTIINANENYYDLMGESIDVSKNQFIGEIYFNVRIIQINIVTLSFLLCDTYELVFCLGVKFFMDDHFTVNGFRTLPLTEEASMFYFIHLFCIILPIFTNFIAFYYVIRRSYDFSESRRMSTCNFSENDIRDYAPKSTKDIEQYLN